MAKDKPPILGLIQRGGQVVLRMLANVQQTTIQPIIEAAVAKGARIHTDEYGVYARLPAWGYQHKTVCHGRGEYARDEDGDGFCEVHVNTIEGFWLTTPHILCGRGMSAIAVLACCSSKVGLRGRWDCDGRGGDR